MEYYFTVVLLLKSEIWVLLPPLSKSELEPDQYFGIAINIQYHCWHICWPITRNCSTEIQKIGIEIDTEDWQLFFNCKMSHWLHILVITVNYKHRCFGVCPPPCVCSPGVCYQWLYWPHNSLYDVRRKLSSARPIYKFIWLLFLLCV